MADDHYCPICGMHCGASDNHEEAEGGGAVEAVAGVANHALDTVRDVVAAHEATDQVAEQADAIEAIAEASETAAEEHSEEVIAEEAGDGGEPGEGVEEEPEEGEDAPAEEEPAEEEEEPAEETGEAEEEEPHGSEATPVGIPPQLEEREAERHRHGRQVPAFRRHRMRARR